MKSTLIGLFMAAAVWAQTTAPAQTASPLKDYLSLTDTQVQSIRTIRQQTQQATASLRQQVAADEKKLQTGLANGAAAVELGQILLDAQALRKQIGTQQTAAQTQIQAVLTADQKTKLQTLSAAAKLLPLVRQAEAMGLIEPVAPAAVGPMNGAQQGGQAMMGRP